MCLAGRDDRGVADEAATVAFVREHEGHVVIEPSGGQQVPLYGGAGAGEESSSHTFPHES